MREFSLEELAENNGRNGKPVYIAHEGKVYDVSGSKLWSTGTHMKRHRSGMDLSTDIGAAPHGPEVLERYPQIGIIREEKGEGIAEETILEPLFKSIPFLRRHPHPMTVHFPIVFMLSATVFSVLYLITGNAALEVTAFTCLVAGLMLTPIVMLTGYVSWWVNYLGRPVRAVCIKLRVSLLMLLVAFYAYLWRALVPDIMTNFRGVSVIYLLLILSLSPMVGIIGWQGAKLTFPLEKQ
ncbi:MAG: hypothetical protein LLG06_06790 [Desulfobacteraceae bacterium]|nr:hypothetical protein [Desulfobacteraceae bacterium]